MGVDHAEAGRWIENVPLMFGSLVMLTYGMGEALTHAGLVGRCEQHADTGLPWGLIVIVTASVLPKTIGRATAGSVWSKIAGGLSSVTGQHQTPKKDEDDDG